MYYETSFEIIELFVFLVFRLRSLVLSARIRCEVIVFRKEDIIRTEKYKNIVFEPSDHRGINLANPSVSRTYIGEHPINFTVRSIRVHTAVVR